MGSAGLDKVSTGFLRSECNTHITGKSSGAGKCVSPNVCQSTTSVFTIDSEGFAAIQAGRPSDGSPLVWGTWRPAGWICESSSGGFVSFKVGQRQEQIFSYSHLVTWTAWRAKPARFQTNPPSFTSKVGTSRLTSL